MELRGGGECVCLGGTFNCNTCAIHHTHQKLHSPRRAASRNVWPAAAAPAAGQLPPRPRRAAPTPPGAKIWRRPTAPPGATWWGGAPLPPLAGGGRPTTRSSTFGTHSGTPCAGGGRMAGPAPEWMGGGVGGWGEPGVNRAKGVRGGKGFKFRV